MTGISPAQNGVGKIPATQVRNPSLNRPDIQIFHPIGNGIFFPKQRFALPQPEKLFSPEH